MCLNIDFFDYEIYGTECTTTYYLFYLELGLGWVLEFLGF